MTALWIIGGVAAMGALLAGISYWMRRSEHFEMGSVSTQWIAEQRLEERSDTHR